MSRILILILRAYQAFLSPLMPGGCKFYPSCSHYAVEAVETHGVRRGGWLAALRVLRCRPFARGGFDPVPAVSNFSQGLKPNIDSAFDGGAEAPPCRETYAENAR